MVNKDIDNLVQKLKNKNDININSTTQIINKKNNVDVDKINIKQQNKNNSKNEFSINDYPLGKKHFNSIKTKTNKLLSDITINNVSNNLIDNKDLSISSKTLLMQSEIAASDNKIELSKNLKRAAEMVSIPDEKLIEIYDILRPNRASEEEILKIASELETQYNAIDTANLLKQTCHVYKKRGLLIKK